MPCRMLEIDPRDRELVFEVSENKRACCGAVCEQARDRSITESHVRSHQSLAIIRPMSVGDKTGLSANNVVNLACKLICGHET